MAVVMTIMPLLAGGLQQHHVAVTPCYQSPAFKQCLGMKSEGTGLQASTKVPGMMHESKQQH